MNGTSLINANEFEPEELSPWMDVVFGGLLVLFSFWIAVLAVWVLPKLRDDESGAGDDGEGGQ